MSELKKKNNKPNHNRERIRTENLLQYLDRIKVSERNKEIVQAYADGVRYQELAEKYGITDNRVSQIIFNYIRHCAIYQRKTSCYRNVDDSGER